MFNNHKKSDFIILSVAFITTLGFHNTASAKTFQREVTSKLEAKIVPSSSYLSSSLLEQNDNENNNFKDYQQESKLANKSPLTAQEVQSKSPQLAIGNNFDNSDDSSLADTLLNNFTDRNSSKTSQNQPKISPVVKIVQRISLLFFLLLFVPLGLFYPFFLFYRKLLETDYDYDDSVQPPEDFEPPFSALPLDEDEVEFEPENDRASIYQLQIAFSPQALRLKHQLEEINVKTKMQQDDKIAELMRQTIDVLITQKYWTHVSNSCSSLPVEDIKREFDRAYYAEKDKCLSRELTLINNQQQQKSDSSSHQDLYSYIVVTLIFATSEASSLSNLSEQIHTREHLIDELTRLSKMRQDNLIDFEVLWNPQQEGHYISNDQLLVDYGNMVRLF